MLTETEKVELLDSCRKMQSLSSTPLPELIKSFDPKFNQQTGVSQIKSGKPAKMKLRNAREMLEIARLKVLVSEMKEKAVKLEAQLLAAAKQHGRSVAKSKEGDVKTKDTKNVNNKDLQDAEKISNKDPIDIQGNSVSSPNVKQGVDMPDDMCMASQAYDKSKHVAGNMQNVMCHNRDLQCMNKNSKDLLEKQDAKLDKDIVELHAQIKNLQSDMDEMVSQLPEKSGLQKELAVAKEKIKGLQEEIKDDAGITKSQLLLLKQQFGELEQIRIATEQKELEFCKVSQLSSALEAEVEELRKGNKEILKHKQELSKKLLKASKKAEKITPVTKDDVLASQAEVSGLRATNVELQKKVESLQMSRFNEVEEVVYLRWVNACLRHDLDTYKDTSEQSKDSVPSSHGKVDQCDLVSCTNSGRSFTTYSEVCEYLASQNDDEESTLSCESSAMSSPQIAVLHDHSNRNRSFALGHLNSSHVSPLTNTPSHVKSGHASPLSVTHGHVNSSPTSPLPIMYGHVRSSHTSPQMPHHGMAKIKSGPLLEVQQLSPSSSTMTKIKSGPLLEAQQLSPSSSYLSQSPEPYNPHRYSPGKVMVERDPQRLKEIQSRLAFNDRSRRSGISFNRSVSDVLPNSEASINRMQSSPQKQQIGQFTRSSSSLSSGSDVSVSNRNMHAIPSRRRHSASSGMSLLDEYLHSTDTRGLNRPTSRFSAVLPYDRQFSDSATVPFPTINEGADPPKRKEHTNMKAHSFESNLDSSDRVVAAFQVLATSSHKTAHRTFKELSRQNSREDKTADKVDDQVTGKYPASENAHVDSNDDGVSREPQKSQSSAKSSQVDFFGDLARAIQASHYKSIEKVAAFVNWFDRQGDVEKQEFLNFPDCPKDKLEAMRRAVYEYEELQALDHDLESYKDDPKSPTDLALKDMKNLLEKVENHIEGFKQARELAMVQFMELGLPTNWMLDSEIIAKIKQASLKLAQKYIKRVLNALQDQQTDMEKLSRDEMLLQAARFLLQIQNFAGGFDDQTASAFKMLQSQADLHDKFSNRQEQNNTVKA